MPKREKMEASKIRPCPRCGAPLPPVGTEMGLGYGQALNVCPKCGNVYLAPSIREIALSGVKFYDRWPIRPLGFGSILLGIGLCVINVLMILFDDSYYPYLFVLCAALVINGLRLSISDLKTYSKRRQFLEQEQQASEQRLRETQYAQKLRELHYGEKPAKS